MNDEDRGVPDAVGSVLEDVARLVDMVVQSFRSGGRLIYVGAGTSGRLGVLDAAECPPTFGTSPDRVQGIIAGGEAALVRSQEGAEDSEPDGARALLERDVCSQDVVVGVAASGVTPFVLGALSQARRVSARTALVTCSPAAAASVQADVTIAPCVGPEAITGSTRLKAGTATKLVLNMVTTATMVRLGKVYENLMVDLVPTCAKLRDRAERILATVCDLPPDRCGRVLTEAGNDLKVAIVTAKRAVSPETARNLLRTCDGVVKEALSRPV